MSQAREFYQEAPERPAPAHPQPIRTEPDIVHARVPANGVATAALVFGLIGVFFGLVPIGAFVAIVSAVFAVLLGIIGRRRARRLPVGGAGRAMAGLVLGVIAIVLSVIGFYVITQGVFDPDRNLDQFDREFQQEMRQLEEDFEIAR